MTTNIEANGKLIDYTVVNKIVNTNDINNDIKVSYVVIALVEFYERDIIEQNYNRTSYSSYPTREYRENKKIEPFNEEMRFTLYLSPETLKELKYAHYNHFKLTYKYGGYLTLFVEDYYHSYYHSNYNLNYNPNSTIVDYNTKSFQFAPVDATLNMELNGFQKSYYNIKLESLILL